MQNLSVRQGGTHLWSTTRQRLPREAAVQGTFRSPSGRAGTMRGWMRFGRFVTAGGQLCAAGVITGELIDADGSVVGVGSRRRLAPAVIVPNGDTLVAEIGPVDVDLLGLRVHLPSFVVPLGRSPERARGDGSRSGNDQAGRGR